MLENEIVKGEEQAIDLFRKEFESLCEKFKISGVCIGTRKPVAIDEEKGKMMCAGFVGSSNMKDVTKPEVSAIVKAYEEAKSPISELMTKSLVKDMFGDMGEKCHCKDCESEEKSEESEK